MIDLLLFLGIVLFIAYALYDQFLMNRLKGETQLAVKLQRQARADGVIFIGLILIIVYQGVLNHIAPLTLFLLSFCIILAIYAVFVRTPRLLLKAHGFFFGNLYFEYANIAQINLAEGKNANEKILVIDLKTGKRLLARVQNADDLSQVVAFFGGYKQTKQNKL